MWCAPELLSAVTTFTTDKDFILQHGISVSGSLRKLHPPFPIMSQKKTMAPIQIKNTSPKKNIPSLKISVPLIGWVGQKFRVVVSIDPRLRDCFWCQFACWARHDWSFWPSANTHEVAWKVIVFPWRRAAKCYVKNSCIFIYDICIIQINVNIYIYVSM